MRVLTYAAVAACLASPSLAKTIELTPNVAFGFVGEIGPDRPDSNCLAVHTGEVLPGGQYIGTMGAQFSADDRRANYEFDVSALGKITSAKLLFSAVEEEAGGGSTNCVLGYAGNGLSDPGDYQPADRQLIGYFDITENLETMRFELLDGMIDITAFLDAFLSGGGEFLGIQFANDDFADNVSALLGVRLVVETVPEPAMMALFGLGLLGISARRRKRL